MDGEKRRFKWVNPSLKKMMEGEVDMAAGQCMSGPSGGMVCGAGGTASGIGGCADGTTASGGTPSCAMGAYQS